MDTRYFYNIETAFVYHLVLEIKKTLLLPVRTHCSQRLLQFLRVYCSTSVAVETDEVLPPAIQDRPELLKFIETHCA